jgi:hypothetical protein
MRSWRSVWRSVRCWFVWIFAIGYFAYTPFLFDSKPVGLVSGCAALWVAFCLTMMWSFEDW